MAWCLTTPSHSVKKWLLISDVLWYSPEDNFISNLRPTTLCNEFEKFIFKTIAISPRGQWVKCENPGPFMCMSKCRKDTRTGRWRWPETVWVHFGFSQPIFVRCDKMVASGRDSFKRTKMHGIRFSPSDLGRVPMIKKFQVFKHCPRKHKESFSYLILDAKYIVLVVSVADCENQNVFESSKPVRKCRQHWFLPLDLSLWMGIVVACVCPSIRLTVRLSSLSVRKLYLVHTITRHKFGLESPNLHKACTLRYSQLILKMGVIDLDLQVHFGSEFE